jgi:hypothetical protein
VDRDKRGVWVYYRARTDALASLGTLIGSRPDRSTRSADRAPASAVPHDRTNSQRALA